MDGEKTPEPYELASIWRFCTAREAAAIALEAFTGIRPQVLGNYKATNGLRLSDLPEMRIVDGKVVFDLIPTRIVVREELSKMCNQYEGFVCEEGCLRLAGYLERRMRQDEVLAPSSAVIADDDGAGRVLTTKGVTRLVKKPFRRAGLEWRQYVLRRYYDVRMGQAAAKPEMGLLESWVTFWMGHSGDVEQVYRHRKKLADSQLEQMREAYARASEMLQTTKLHKDNGGQIRREIRSAALMAVGCSDDDIKQLDLDKLNTEEFSEALRKRLTPKQQQPRQVSPQYKIVKVSELEEYVNGGAWKPIKRLQNDTKGLAELRTPFDFGARITVSRHLVALTAVLFFRMRVRAS